MFGFSEVVLAGTFLVCLTAWGALSLAVAAFGLYLVHLAARGEPYPGPRVR